MNKLINLFETHVAPVFLMIASNRYVKSISNGFIIASPLTIAGALFQMVISLPLGSGYTQFLQSSGLQKYLSVPLLVTTEMLSLLVVATIAYQLAKSFKKDGMIAAIIALSCFLIVTPFGVSQTAASGEVIVIEKALSTQWLGAQGLFVAMIVAILSTRVYAFVIDKNWIIKMPEGVPSNVANAFESLVPGIIILTMFVLIKAGFAATPFGSIHHFIFFIFQRPLTSLGNSLPAYLFAVLLMQLLWLVGVHGPMVVASIMIPIWAAAATENLQLYLSGGVPIHVISTAFYIMYGSAFGGSGNTLPLVFMMAFKSKSKQLKTLGKLAIGPSIFNINEPIIFGLPIVMNPMTAIPFVFAPVITVLIAYFATRFAFVPIPPGIQGPTQIPVFIKAFLLGGNGAWKIAILHLVILAVSTVIWYPFFKILDKNLYNEEKNSN